MVPNLDRGLINPQVLEAPFSKVHGMARLLLLERFHNTDEQHKFKQRQRQLQGRSQQQRVHFMQRLGADIEDADEYDELHSGRGRRKASTSLRRCHVKSPLLVWRRSKLTTAASRRVAQLTV